MRLKHLFLLYLLLFPLFICCANKKESNDIKEFYIASELQPWLYSIYDIQNNIFCYLLLGEEKALLFDTTSGGGILYSVIKEITELPVTVVLGNGRRDNAGGAAQLKAHLDSDIWLNEADFEIYGHYFKETRLLKKLETNHVFDLGGLHIDVIEMEGHTPGSIGIIAREHRVLFTSDSAGHYTWLYKNNFSSVSQYAAMLERVMRHDFDYFYIGHDDTITPRSEFQLFINAAHNAAIEKSYYREDISAFHYEENGVNIYFRDADAARERLASLEANRSSVPGNLGVFDFYLRDNFRYGHGYQNLIRDRNLLNGYRLRKGDVFTLKVTYTASRDLENEILVGFVDAEGSRWKTLSYIQKEIEPPDVVLGHASKAGETVSSEVTITVVTDASSSRPAANSIVINTIGEGRHGRAGTGVQGPVMISFSEFVLTKR